MLMDHAEAGLDVCCVTCSLSSIQRDAHLLLRPNLPTDDIVGITLFDLIVIHREALDVSKHLIK